MKNLSKKNKIIIGVCLLLVVIVIGLIVGFGIKKNKTNNSVENDINVREMLNNSSKLEVKIGDDKRIELSNVEGLDTDKQVKLWVFSNPVYLGEFTLVKSDDKYYLEGLEDVLKTKYIISDTHSVLILQDDKALGYFVISLRNGSLLSSEELRDDITPNDEDTSSDNNVPEDSNTENNDKPANNTVNKDNNTEKEETTTKEVEVLEDIKFKTEEIKEEKMLKNKKETVEAGENGQKKITYKVTYDKNNKEIKREKVSEVVVKEAKNAKVKVGLSDYNLNEEPTYSIISGLICDEAEASSMGYKECDDTKSDYTNYYQAIEIGSKSKLICFNGRVCDDYFDVHFELSSYPSISKYQGMYTVNYGGSKYFLDMRSGSDKVLDENICNKLGLVCNRW